ncbi:DMT family transporter [Gephyromycinifex aptenodytis]|uniref:DMT family transporter n=1 Tax=Gephyromycinifex aptenodytis TaxID=2716227 RepID=UPI00144610CF|nr:DMT family transporter [Gephyromycinifex aptenodytis]
MTTLFLALSCAGAFGVSDFLGGLASRRVPALRVLLLSYPASAVLMTALALGIPGRIEAGSLWWGSASGIAMGLAAWTFFLALAQGPISIVSPLTSLLGAVLPMLVGILLGERPGPVAVLGIVIALVAVALVSLAPTSASAATRPFTAKVAALTLTAGCTFAASFVLTAQISDGTGLWPLVSARWSATAMVVAATLLSRERALPPAPVRLLALGVAILDVAANITMLLALQSGLLSVASVLISLFPAVTVLLALVVLREHLTRVQVAGLLLGFLAVAMIGEA